MADQSPIPPSPRPNDGGARPETTHGGTRSALLLGSDHIELEQIAIEKLTPTLAIGISRGRFAKGYPHTDPNEDAVFAATDGTTTILAVADGHHGFDAARAAVNAIADRAPQVSSAPMESVVRYLAEAAIAAVAGAIPRLPQPRNASRTSLTIAARRHTDVAATTIGDTACFLPARRRRIRLGADTEFLSPETDAGSLEIDQTTLSDRSSVVLATDGFVEFTGDAKASLRAAAKLEASSAVEHLISEAFAGGAGDNIAVAVHRLH